MKCLLLAILIVSLAYSFKINFNTSYVGKGITMEKSSNTKDVKQHNRAIIDSGENREKNKEGYVYEAKYIFNQFPNEGQQSRLNFIRDTMHRVFGQTKFCNISTHDNQIVDASLCHQSCSCGPSCHDTRDCCPDIQHKLVHITHNETDKTTNLTKPRPVCKTLHDILYQLDTSTNSPLKITKDEKLTVRSIEDSEKNQVGNNNRTASSSRGKYQDNQGKVQDNHGKDLDQNQPLEEMESKFTFPNYLVIESCPAQYKNNDIVKKCQEDNPTLILDIIPVVDWYSNTIYRNKHCAACNNIRDTIPWAVATDCIELYQNYCPISTTGELSKIILQGKCKVLMIPSFEMNENSPKCNSDSNDIIGSCSKTGHLSEHERITKKLCEQPDMIAHFYAKNGSGTLAYKNMFCYLCNEPGNARKSQTQDCYNKTTITKNKNHDTLLPNFEVILNEEMFVETDHVSKSCNSSQSNLYKTVNSSQGPDDCRQDEIWDVYKDKCRQLICPIYQTPYQQLCIQKQTAVRGLIISAQLLVKVPKDSYIMVGSDHVSNSEDSFVLLLNSKTDSVPSSNTIILKGFFEEVYQSIEKSLKFHMYKCETKHIQVLAKSEEKKMKYFIFQVKVENNYRCSVEALINLYQEIATGIKIIQSPNILQENGISTIHVGLEYHTLPLENFNIKQIIMNGRENKANEITIEPLFYCPRIQLSLREYNQSIKTGIIKELSTHDFDLQFKKATQTVDICLLSYLKQWLNNKYKIAFQNKIKSKAGIESKMSMVATLTSMISTVIVLVTYSIFSELRFVPGKLFMILCVNLLLAQFFFAFGSNEGYSDLLCKFIGIGIHFFWLATIFSMSSCLSLMIHSIKSPMDHNNRVLMQSKSICKASKYVLITYCAPLLMVVTNFVMASVRKAPYDGYGGDFCYISTNTLRIYTFAIPVGIVICINFTFFAMIFTNLIHVIKSNQKSNHQYVLVFLKLTTITGMFWTFGFLYEATQIVYFAYLFTILNAGQGFFLMWSFILNKRVINLYVNKIKKYSNTFHSWNISASTGHNSLHKKIESIDPGQLAPSDQV